METFQCGPSGGQGGNRFDDEIPADGVFISQIDVWSGTYIDAIQLTYSDNSRTTKHGGPGGSLSTWALNAGESIIEVYGFCGSYVDSLAIRTNMRNLPTVGGNGGSIQYTYRVPDNMHVIGLLGASGSYVDALGIFFREVSADGTAFTAVLRSTSSCEFELEASWPDDAPVVTVYGEWYFDGTPPAPNGTFVFTTQAPGTGPNAGTIEGNLARFTAGPLYPSSTAYPWYVLVQFYDASGAQLASIYSNVDMTACANQPGM